MDLRAVHCCYSCIEPITTFTDIIIMCMSGHRSEAFLRWYNMFHTPKTTYFVAHFLKLPQTWFWSRSRSWPLTFTCSLPSISTTIHVRISQMLGCSDSVASSLHVPMMIQVSQSSYITQHNYSAGMIANYSFNNSVYSTCLPTVDHPIYCVNLSRHEITVIYNNIHPRYICGNLLVWRGSPT